jgi:hypothetical protein
MSRITSASFFKAFHDLGYRHVESQRYTRLKAIILAFKNEDKDSIPPKCYQFTRLHGVKTQKITIFITTAVKNIHLKFTSRGCIIPSCRTRGPGVISVVG